MSLQNRFRVYDQNSRKRDELTGLIFDIERFAIHNGPGIRTLVFFKGCNVKCDWCHNPESYHHQAEVVRIKEKCIGCGTCVQQCKGDCLANNWAHGNAPVIDRSKCLMPDCGFCATVCYSDAISVSGRYLTVSEVMEEVEKDREFYGRTGGGVTFSGGEPLAQPDFLEALAKESVKRGFDTAIETCGAAPWKSFQSVLKYINTVIFDLKHMDPEKHLKYAKISNNLILENIRHIDALSIPIRIRMPLVPGFNDSDEDIKATAAFVSGLKNLQAFDIYPYNRMCEPKWTHLGIHNELQGVPPHAIDEVARLAQIARDFGITVTVGG
jgi:pyruvate formate lyase activating enzyme